SLKKQWELSDDVEALTLKKFKGDLAYRRQEYQRALQEYSRISEKLPSTNFAMKRDVQEGQARCLVHLGRHMEALEIATNLEARSTNNHLTTVLTSSWLFGASLPDSRRQFLCLQKLISCNPFDALELGAKLARGLPESGPSFCQTCVRHLRNRTESPPVDKTIKILFPHSGKDCLLCFLKPCLRARVLRVKQAAAINRRTRKLRMKACASLYGMLGTCPLKGTQLVEHLTLGFSLGHDIRVMGSSPELASPLSWIPSLPPSLPLHALCLSK
uniref:Uncharacterized protein n=1 Tax=Ursus americanus TaxID=9643 RepID=A0A452R8J9_URSAM